MSGRREGESMGMRLRRRPGNEAQWNARNERGERRKTWE